MAYQGYSHSRAASSSHSHERAVTAPEAEDVDISDSEAGEPSESAHQATVVATFDSYLRKALSANQRRRGDYFSLTEAHRALLAPDFNDFLKSVDSKLQINAELVSAMIESNVFPPEDPDAALSAPAPKEGDHERLRSTLRQCVRDWSDLGEVERDETYGPILWALDSIYANVKGPQRAQLQVLVPGAGLGRLAWEIVRAGFSCQANEFSLFMLIASAFILNHTTQKNQYPLYPYLHSFSNIRSRKDLLEPVFIPDVLPSDITSSEGDFSFAAGSFEGVYGNDTEKWDAVGAKGAQTTDDIVTNSSLMPKVTCFFIDTARNIVEYLERIYAVLKHGGTWINCGPTLWHFENTAGARSIELTVEDVKELAKRIGFVIVEAKEIHTSYTSNPRSLLQHRYTAAFWVAKKL